jgi:hypothetical protein
MTVAARYVKHEDESCWTHEYLLRHSERYRVDSEDGHLGYVEEVILAPDESEPVGLLVRGNAGVIVVSIEQIRELSPRGERILVDLDPGGDVADAPEPDRADAAPASALRC